MAASVSPRKCHEADGRPADMPYVPDATQSAARRLHRPTGRSRLSGGMWPSLRGQPARPSVTSEVDSVEKVGRKAQAGRSERDAAVVISPLTF